MRKLVCFGDSITARQEGFSEPMLTTKLSDKLQGYEVVNAGVAGDNTFDALKRLEHDVMSQQPDLVTVLFGANDAAIHKMVELGDYQSNLFKMVKQIGPDRTILISPSPVDEAVQFARTNGILSRYVSAVEQVAKETGSHYIDFFSYMFAQKDYKDKLKGIRNDGLHFGEQGYDVLVSLIHKKIEA
ncbi:SGNH/GDSL hydrolase family protein [Jeotgalibacillus sp. R-1-5s-1]|uniref:SGNH/GDSL hydrolase family protein n=1 Tax=Jeotgalibacillus sp. R-1-5s-1 TaxID=2555897 RepID=UPI00106CCDBE|nr:SGNH/GDSL hydrolase family protein [Jeotgalibacillus sp. R-1-5s-1]TFD94378.1 esterase [Jeotgalibacillus sp. R-1-5s-1]